MTYCRHLQALIRIGLPLALLVGLAGPAPAGLEEAHQQALAVYENTKDPVEGIKALEAAGIRRALEKKPTGMALKVYAHLLNDYGFFLSQSPDRYREAIPVLERATEMDSDRSVAFLNLGDVYWKIMEEAPDCRTQDKLLKEALSAYEHYQRLVAEQKTAAVLSAEIEELLAAWERGPIQHLLPVRGRCEYKLVLSKDDKNDKVCHYVLDALNQDIMDYGRGGHAEKFKDPVFTAIPWARSKFGQVARFDINNDGPSETVILSTNMKFNKSSNQLFILDRNQSPESFKTRKDLYENSPGMVTIDAYAFKGFFPCGSDETPQPGGCARGLGEFVEIYPFIFQKTSYVLLKHSSDVKPDPSEVVVAKYKKGRIRLADPKKMEDICYME